MKVEFGQNYRDTISGYEGVATARAEYWHSGTEVLLVALGAKDGAANERWIKEARLALSAPRDVGFSES